jgi:hypothetical protein
MRRCIGRMITSSDGEVDEGASELDNTRARAPGVAP